ncbi:MAG: DEAD/DEAH box helicase family protein [Bacteroidales bacterium]|nr:DEAD/DEAH box helicase family protein [Bacteroidales bacterium]
MKETLFPFQRKAVNQLRVNLAESFGSYNRTHTPQIVSFTAPTGAGKTIIMASLIEEVYFGNEMFAEQPNAIFLWISDSPELNEQSKQKIDLKADRITLQQTITIEESSFDRELLEDGHIYFLNTQKLSRTSNLTKHSDTRQYTIWETLKNTIEEKSDHFYVIIDEAHRGMQGRQASTATTIMQKFILGSPGDGLPTMPVVVGMSATIQRFNTLVGNSTSTLRRVDVLADEVRSSGLLKDVITVNYPEEGTGINKMAILQAATDEWNDKVEHWHQYCYEQHYAYVNPVFVVQVEKSTHSSRYSDTDLNECLRIIASRSNQTFKEGEVVHTFGDPKSTITINNIPVQYREPSAITDDRNIKLVFFKENLSTGWDCPRAECMMSFRKADDYTNIAQLLGRMIRTPMQMHINVDDTLNNVHLFLPEFNKENVKKVIEELQKGEGGDIPVEISPETIGSPSSQILTVFPTEIIEETIEINSSESASTPDEGTAITSPSEQGEMVQVQTQERRVTTDNPDDVTPTNVTENPNLSPAIPLTPAGEQPEILVLTPEKPVIKRRIRRPVSDGVNRAEIMKAINELSLLSYDVRSVRINKNYLSSLFAFCRFLSQFGLNDSKLVEVRGEIIRKIREYAEELRSSGRYEELSKNVMEFKLASESFDFYGMSIVDSGNGALFSSTDTDLDRQMRLAETKFCGEGIGNLYGQVYYNPDNENEYKIDVILFVVNETNITSLKEWAKDNYHNLIDTYRRRVTSLDERGQKRFNSIVSDGDEVSQHNFRLPENINVSLEQNGQKYKKHLFVDEKCEATFNLNGWERKLLEEEMKRDDFVSWLRNPPRKPWALCVPYEQNGQMHGMYPDFIVICKDEEGYVIDILEPHDPSRTDNLPKAIGLAKYAAKETRVRRIQLIRMENGVLKRIDVSKKAIRDMVLLAASDHELNNIFINHSL